MRSPARAASCAYGSWDTRAFGSGPSTLSLASSVCIRPSPPASSTIPVAGGHRDLGCGAVGVIKRMTFATSSGSRAPDPTRAAANSFCVESTRHTQNCSRLWRSNASDASDGAHSTRTTLNLSETNRIKFDRWILYYGIPLIFLLEIIVFYCSVSVYRMYEYVLYFLYEYCND